MKNLKKFLAVVLAVAMIASSMATAFAADDPLAEKYPEAALMRDLGILKGSTGVTEAYLQQKPVRIQAAILTLRLMGKEEEALAYSGLAHFEDKIADTYWAKNVMGYLKNNPAYGWYGDNQGKLNPESKIQKEEFAKVLLKAMGYDQGTHYEWSGVMHAYKAAGLTYLEDVDADGITMNDIAVAIDEALRKPVRGSTETLASKLAGLNESFKAAAIAKGLVSEVKIASVVNPDLGSAGEGSVVYPPAQVLATMSDGSTKMVDVAWEADKFDTSEAGEVTINGTIEGFAAGATATLTVIAAEIVEVADVEFEDAYVGQEVDLPETVEATFSNGKVEEVAVVWDPAEVDTSEVAELTFTGTVEGYGEITATMNVVEDEIDEVDVEDITINEGEALELPEEVEATYKSGKVETVAVEWDTEAVDTAVAGTYEVVGTIGEEYEVTVNVEVVAVELDFELSADNLSEVTVTFNKPVDSAVLVKDNFVLNGATPANVKVVDSKTVVLLKATPIAKQGKFEVTVKKAVGMADDTKKSTDAIVDAIVPAVLNVEAVGNSAIKVTFSEPITSGIALSNMKLNNAYFGAKSPTVDATGRIMTIEPTTRLGVGPHKLTLSNFADGAGWVIPTADYEFVVAEDKTAPSFVSVESVTQTKVVIVMDEPITVPADADVVSAPNEAGRSVDGNKLTLTYNTGAAAIPVGGMTITLKNITDMYGNKAADMTIVIPAPSLDLTRPSFVSADVEASDNVSVKVVVTFDKDVQTKAGSFVVKDKDGKVVAGLSGITRYKDADGKDVGTKLYVSGALAAGNYKLSVSGVVDATGLENVMLPVSDIAITVPDKTAPGVANPLTWYKNDATNKIYIVFDKALNEASAETKTNYSYVEAATNYVKNLDGDTTVTLLADGKTVEIAFKAATYATVNRMQVYGVQDTNGNAMAYATQDITALVSGLPGAPTAVAKVTGKNTIQLDVTGSLVPSSVAVTDFEVTSGPAGSTATVRVYNATYDGSKIVLYTVDDLAFDGTFNNNAVEVRMASSASSKNAFGQNLTIPTATAADAYAPTIELTSVVGNVITLTASEALAAGTDVSLFTIVVDGSIKAYTATIDATSKVITINVTGAALATGKTVNVKYYKPAAGQITDVAGNDVPSFEFAGTVE